MRGKYQRGRSIVVDEKKSPQNSFDPFTTIRGILGSHAFCKTWKMNEQYFHLGGKKWKIESSLLLPAF